MLAFPAVCHPTLTAVLDPPGPGPLRAGRHQRLLGEPSLRRSPGGRVGRPRHLVVTCEGTEVARHRRCLARHQNPAGPRALPHPAHHARRAGRCRHPRRRREERDLAVYDPHYRGGVMATITKPTSDLAYLCRALKAPTLARAVQRLAERARSEGWTHEEFLAACLEREAAARPSTAGKSASAPPASRPGRPSRSSTSAISTRCGATSSPTSAPWTWSRPETELVDQPQRWRGP